MSVLIRVFIRITFCVLAVGLLGCGCLYPFMPTPQSPNLYADVYKANDLRYEGKYAEAIAKYEQASKKLPRFPVDTKAVNVSFPTFFKYHIAFCYAKLAEAEGDISLYIKAEAAARKSSETAVLPSDQVDVLYLWGYILFKQERYEEARAKFEKILLIGTPPRNKFGTNFDGEVLYGLGKAHLALGDKAAAQQALAQLEAITQGADSYFNTAGVICGLGKAYLELGDESAARRIFAQLEALIEVTLQNDRLGWDADGIYAKIPYGLGKAYLELDDKTAARRVFAQLEVLINMALQKEYVGPDAEEIYAEVMYGLGKAYLELDDATAAQRIFAQLLKHYPKSSYKAEMERLLEKQ